MFGAASARASLASGHTLIAVLRRFGWLVHPTKCVGISEAAQAFQALGVWVDLVTQTYSVPPAAVQHILSDSSPRLKPWLLARSNDQCACSRDSKASSLAPLRAPTPPWGP